MMCGTIGLLFIFLPKKMKSTNTSISLRRRYVRVGGCSWALFPCWGPISAAVFRNGHIQRDGSHKYVCSTVTSSNVSITIIKPRGDHCKIVFVVFSNENSIQLLITYI